MAFLDDITVAVLEADPYPIYARLRAEAPVAFVPAVKLWFVTRWRDCEFMGRHPELFIASSPSSPVERTMGRPTILTCDGAVHRELRRSIEPKYRQRPVATYIEQLVRPIAQHYLDQLAPKGEADLMAEYFEPLSTLALARSLGLQDVEMGTLRRWFAGLSIGAANYEDDAEKQKLADAVSAEITAAVTPVMERLARERDDSALSHMLHDGLPEGQTRAISFLLPTIKVALLGGMQEPGHGAGSILYGLLSNPDQRAALKGDMNKLPQAVNEGIRWIAPIGTQLRTTAAAVELGGVTIPAGAPVVAVLSSACRDEARFRDAETYDLHRQDAGTAAYGFGAHYCAGRVFAQQQIEVALRLLLERLPDLAMQPEDPPTFFGWEFRAPRAFRVCFTPA